MKLEIEKLVARVIDEDAQHRSGWRPSEFDGKDFSEIGFHLSSETLELRNALWELHHMPLPDDTLLPHAVEELADVFAVVMHIANRLGVSIDDLDAEACRKVKMRFTFDKRD